MWITVVAIGKQGGDQSLGVFERWQVAARVDIGVRARREGGAEGKKKEHVGCRDHPFAQLLHLLVHVFKFKLKGVVISK
jgi:hypothetical protein